jgi:phenylalanyl-tRNA synthetase beta chain
MGGANTEIDETTKTIIIESATFNLYKLRSTQMRHGIFSEAITRFTKGQPAELTAPVLHEAVRLMGEFAQATPVTAVAESYPGTREVQPLHLTVEAINATLGSKLAAEDAVEIMQNVEFTVGFNHEDRQLAFKAPFWRSDIHIPEDIIEEIGRLNGFDSIEPTLPSRDFTAVRPSSFDELRADVRKNLTRAGANEVLTYSFVHGDMLKKSGQDPVDSYRIVNSISPDLQYYRQTITPSLLTLIHPNVKQGYDTFAVFELNKTHPKQTGMTDEGVPVEIDLLGLTTTSKKTQAGAAYYQAKKLLEYMATSFGLSLEYTALDAQEQTPMSAPFEYRRSAIVSDKSTGVRLGIVGEYKKSVSKNFKLPEYTAGFELETVALFGAVQQLGNSYTPISRYPSVERDICFQVADEIAYRQIIDAVEAALTNVQLETSIQPVDIYRPADAVTKNITLRLKLTAHDRTLTGDEVASIVAGVVDQVAAATAAVVI